MKLTSVPLRLATLARAHVATSSGTSRLSRVARLAGVVAAAGGLTVGVLVAGVFGASQIAEASHGVPLDHFKCYLAQDPTAWNQAVMLADQFLPNGFQTRVANAIRFCNPVEKNHNGVVTPINDPDAHLTIYRLTPLPPPITRNILVSNQFNVGAAQQQWVVTGPALLAVPTQKQGHANPPRHLDHFLCYRAQGPVVNAGAIVLRDEFLTENINPVLQPVMFCNPVKKLHNGVVTPIEHPDEHLACYTIQGLPGQRVRFIRNQFGVEQILITNPSMLCAPSKKEVLPPPT